MKIAILTTKSQWFVKYAQVLSAEIKADLFYEHEQIDSSYDIVFMLSYHKIVPKEYLAKHRHNLVIHASALPEGKGWAPMFWQVLEGKNNIPITLFEASVGVDDGDIYLVDYLELDGTELNSELRHKLSLKITHMCKTFLSKYPILPVKQSGIESFYPKRTPRDSMLDINKSIKEQFNLLRIVDNDEYPAFFEINGVRYIIKIEKEQGY